MSRSRVVSVNVGGPRPVSWAEALPTTCIDKRPVSGRVAVSHDGLEGDAVSDTKHHGGTYQAVYAYSVEDYAWWSDRLGSPLAAGAFGENLTTEGLDLTGAVLGEVWQIGDVRLQVVAVRIPCRTFKGRVGELGLDNTAWVKRFTEAGRPGPYLRVLDEGDLAAGDQVEVVDRPDHAVTVETMFRAFTTERSLLPELLKVEGLNPKVYDAARRYLAEQSGR